MTVQQLKDRCWVLNDNGDETHFTGRAPTKGDLFRLHEDDPDPDATVTELETPCWVVSCDGECEVTLDTEDEGYVIHHASRAEAEETMASYDWVYVGDLVFCEEDAPADGRVPPPSPAQQEAAGQLRIPGVA